MTKRVLRHTDPIPDLRAGRLAGGWLFNVNAVLTEAPLAASLGNGLGVNRGEGDRHLLRALSGDRAQRGVFALLPNWFYAGASDDDAVRRQIIRVLSEHYKWSELPDVEDSLQPYFTVPLQIIGFTEMSNEPGRSYRPTQLFAKVCGQGQIIGGRIRLAQGRIEDKLLVALRAVAETGLTLDFMAAPDGLRLTYIPPSEYSRENATDRQIQTHIGEVWENLDGLVVTAMERVLGGKAQFIAGR